MERAGIRKTKDSGEEVNRETQALTWNLFLSFFLRIETLSVTLLCIRLHLSFSFFFILDGAKATYPPDDVTTEFPLMPLMSL